VKQQVHPQMFIVNQW